MKSPPDEIRTDWRSRRGAYLGTAFVLAALALVLVGAMAVWLKGVRPGRPSRTPVGFTEDWACQGASPKGGGFCWRSPRSPASPSSKSGPAPISQDHTRP